MTLHKHPIVRIDIPGADREALARFYHDLFGWRIELPGTPSPPAAPPGVVPLGTGNIPGGIAAIDGRRHRGGDVIVYVASEDVDADLKQAVALGASVLVGRSEAPGVAQFAIFTDPSGCRIGLWKSLRPPGE